MITNEKDEKTNVGAFCFNWKMAKSSPFSFERSLFLKKNNRTIEC